MSLQRAAARRHRCATGLLLTMLLMAVALPGPVLAAPSGCRFVLGFQALAAEVSQVGVCLDNEHPDPAGTGNELQDTSGGLLVWDPASGVTSFTNGSVTWLEGPLGLQRRLNTVRFAWENAAPRAPRTTVVFVGGYESTLVNTQADFAGLSQALVAQDHFTPDDLVIFSYRGATVTAEKHIVPIPYAACDTAADLDHSETALADFLRQVQDARGGRLAVIGESLGGLLAYGLPSVTSGLRLATVVTVDSPLKGIDGQLAGLAAFDDCGQAAAEGLAALAVDPSRLAELGQLHAGLQAMGARVAALANAADCVYDLQLCGFAGPDIRATQLAPAEWAQTFDEPGDGSIAGRHAALLSDIAVVNRIAAFVGAAA